MPSREGQAAHAQGHGTRRQARRGRRPRTMGRGVFAGQLPQDPAGHRRIDHRRLEGHAPGRGARHRPGPPGAPPARRISWNGCPAGAGVASGRRCPSPTWFPANDSAGRPCSSASSYRSKAATRRGTAPPSTSSGSPRRRPGRAGAGIGAGMPRSRMRGVARPSRSASPTATRSATRSVCRASPRPRAQPSSALSWCMSWHTWPAPPACRKAPTAPL